MVVLRKNWIRCTVLHLTNEPELDLFRDCCTISSLVSNRTIQAKLHLLENIEPGIIYNCCSNTTTRDRILYSSKLRRGVLHQP